MNKHCMNLGQNSLRITIYRIHIKIYFEQKIVLAAIYLMDVLKSQFFDIRILLRNTVLVGLHSIFMLPTVIA